MTTATYDITKSAAIFEQEAQFLAPGTQSVATMSRLTMDHGEGACLWDVDGNRYIDLLAGVGVASLGYGHKKYARAIAEQVARSHVGSFTTQHRADLVKLIASLTPGDLNRTQLYSGGSEAVEAAIRLAMSYTGHREVIGFWGGFHGKTGGVLPLMGSTFKHGLGPLHPNRAITPYASCARCEFGKTFPACDWHCVKFGRKMVDFETAKDVAAILVEPIQGTAGNVVPPPGYLAQLRKWADDLGALLICDEMITGFGRTGKMFAIEHEGVLPDIITVGKGFGGGFPVSGLIASEKVAFAKPFALPSGSSSSYGGNPLASAAAHVTVRTIVEEGLVENSRKVGEVMQAELRSWKHPMVSDVRGRGMMIGLDLVVPGTRTLIKKDLARWIFDTCLSRGVICMIYNPEVRINPPLVITEEQALEALRTVRGVLDEAAVRARA